MAGPIPGFWAETEAFLARRIFLLGLDGGSWNAFDHLFAQGVMPRFAEMCAGGAHGTLTSTVPPITPCAWTSLMSGTNPGKHGVFAFHRKRDDNSYFPAPINRTHMQVPTVFDYYREDPGFVCLNLPMSFPATPIAGRMVTGMMTPLHGDVACEHPPGLLAELRGKGIDYVIDPRLPEEKDLDQDALFTTWRDMRPAFVERLTRVTNARMQAVNALMDEVDWSLFVTVIVGTDRLQHLFWDELVPPDGGATTDDLIAYYRAVDGHIGALRDRLEPDDVLMVISDHGFVRTHGSFQTNQWLLRQGWLKRREAKRSPWYPLKVALNKLGITRRRLGKVLSDKQSSDLQMKASHIDWARSEAFFSGPFAIRVNLQGRETAGCVPPERYDTLVDSIIAALKELRDEDGEILLSDVVRGDALYHGDAAARGGDVVFTFRDDRNHTAYAAELGSELFRGGTGKTGDHRVDGIWAAAGGGIRSLDQRHRLAIWDILPTLMHLNGRAVPGICDGRVADEILVDAGEVRTDPDWQRFRSATNAVVYDSAQEQEINERLRALGYMADED